MFTRQITRVALTGLALAVLLGVFAPGCGDDEQQAEPPVDPRLVGLQFTDDELPRLDSSTSARPLIIWIASHLTGRECLWSPIPKMMLGRSLQIFPVALRPDVTAAMYDEASRSESPFKGMASLTDYDFLKTLSLHGTHGSYVQLIEDKADLIIVAREPSKDELTLAKEKNVELDVRAVALDAFVFLRNDKNPVTNLTAEQIRAWEIEHPKYLKVRLTKAIKARIRAMILDGTITQYAREFQERLVTARVRKAGSAEDRVRGGVMKSRLDDTVAVAGHAARRVARVDDEAAVFDQRRVIHRIVVGHDDHRVV